MPDSTWQAGFHFHDTTINEFQKLFPASRRNDTRERATRRWWKAIRFRAAVGEERRRHRCRRRNSNVPRRTDCGTERQ